MIRTVLFFKEKAAKGHNLISETRNCRLRDSWIDASAQTQNYTAVLLSVVLRLLVNKDALSDSSQRTHEFTDKLRHSCRGTWKDFKNFINNRESK